MSVMRSLESTHVGLFLCLNLVSEIIVCGGRTAAILSFRIVVQ
jgi:hypothetical protein